MFMVVTTGTALVLNFPRLPPGYRIGPETLVLTNMTIAAVLFLLGGLVVFEAVRVWRMSRGGVPAPTQV
jgi:hypothetical protein